MLLIPEIKKYAINARPEWTEWTFQTTCNHGNDIVSSTTRTLKSVGNLTEMSEIKCVIRTQQTHAGPK